MRIIIEVEGEDVTFRTERTEKPSRMYASDTPPPEILRAAEALGATSAGPAPREAEPTSLAEGLTPTATAPLSNESVDAGAGPFPPPGLSGLEADEADDPQGS